MDDGYINKRVRVNKEKWDKVQEYGYNQSELMELIIDILTSEDFEFYDHKIKINFFTKLVNKKELEIQKCKDDVTNAIVNYHKNVSDYISMNSYLKSLVDDYEQNVDQMNMVKLKSNLNNAIINSDYNIIVVRDTCSNIIEKIIELDPKFDLELHMNSLKNLLC